MMAFAGIPVPTQRSKEKEVKGSEMVKFFDRQLQQYKALKTLETNPADCKPAPTSAGKTLG
jgi:hypothetical protein